MGQKSRAKRQNAPKRTTPIVQQTNGTGNPSSQPSIVKSSSTFQPKMAQFEEALLVRRSDIRKIGFLGAIMILLLAALTVFSVASPLLQKAGNRLAQAARL